MSVGQGDRPDEAPHLIVIEPTCFGNLSIRLRLGRLKHSRVALTGRTIFAEQHRECLTNIMILKNARKKSSSCR